MNAQRISLRGGNLIILPLRQVIFFKKKLNWMHRPRRVRVEAGEEGLVKKRGRGDSVSIRPKY